MSNRIECQVCGVKVKTLADFKRHVRAVAHQQRVAEVFNTDVHKGPVYFPTIMIPVKLAKHLFTHPVIGLDLCTLCMSSGSNQLFYLCHVCEEKFSEAQFIEHLDSPDHYTNYYSYTDPDKLHFSWIPGMSMLNHLRPLALIEFEAKGPGLVRVLDMPERVLKGCKGGTYSKVMQTLSLTDLLAERITADRPKQWTLMEYQKDPNRRNPLVGLQHIVKYSCKKPFKKWAYLCTLCLRSVPSNQIIRHVLSFDHLYWYFKEWHPSTLEMKDFYKDYNCRFRSMMQDLSSQAEKISGTTNTEVPHVQLEPGVFTSVGFSGYKRALDMLEAVRKERKESSLKIIPKRGNKLIQSSNKSKISKAVTQTIDCDAGPKETESRSKVQNAAEKIVEVVCTPARNAFSAAKDHSTPSTMAKANAGTKATIVVKAELNTDAKSNSKANIITNAKTNATVSAKTQTTTAKRQMTENEPQFPTDESLVDLQVTPAEGANYGIRVTIETTKGSDTVAQDKTSKEPTSETANKIDIGRSKKTGSKAASETPKETKQESVAKTGPEPKKESQKRTEENPEGVKGKNSSSVTNSKPEKNVPSTKTHNIPGKNMTGEVCRKGTGTECDGTPDKGEAIKHSVSTKESKTGRDSGSGSPQTDDLWDYLKRPQREPVIGLSTLLECHTEGQAPFYLCEACQSIVKQQGIINHLTSAPHQRAYMCSLNMTAPSGKKMGRKLRRAVRELEKDEGCGKAEVVDLDGLMDDYIKMNFSRVLKTAKKALSNVNSDPQLEDVDHTQTSTDLWNYLTNSGRTQPIIGLNVVTEVRLPEQPSQNYFWCDCCFVHFQSESYIYHLISACHRYNYIKLKHPCLILDWPENVKPAARTGRLFKLAKELEGKEGWGRLQVKTQPAVQSSTITSSNTLETSDAFKTATAAAPEAAAAAATPDTTANQAAPKAAAAAANQAALKAAAAASPPDTAANQAAPKAAAAAATPDTTANQAAPKAAAAAANQAAAAASPPDTAANQAALKAAAAGANQDAPKAAAAASPPDTAANQAAPKAAAAASPPDTTANQAAPKAEAAASPPDTTANQDAPKAAAAASPPNTAANQAAPKAAAAASPPDTTANQAAPKAEAAASPPDTTANQAAPKAAAAASPPDTTANQAAPRAAAAASPPGTAANLAAPKAAAAAVPPDTATAPATSNGESAAQSVLSDSVTISTSAALKLHGTQCRLPPACKTRSSVSVKSPQLLKHHKKWSRTTPVVGLNFLVSVSYRKEMCFFCQLCSVRMKDCTDHKTSFSHRYNYVRLKYPGWTTHPTVMERKLLKMVAHLAKVDRDAGLRMQKVKVKGDEFRQLVSAPKEDALRTLEAIIKSQRKGETEGPERTAPSTNPDATPELELPQFPSISLSPPLAVSTPVTLLSSVTPLGSTHIPPVVPSSPLSQSPQEPCPGDRDTQTSTHTPCQSADTPQSPEHPEGSKESTLLECTTLALPEASFIPPSSVASMETVLYSPTGAGQDLKHTLTHSSPHTPSQCSPALWLSGPQVLSLPNIATERSALGHSHLSKFLRVKGLHNKEPIIGLDCVMECRGIAQDTFFMCGSCAEIHPSTHICEHIVTARHQHCYMRMQYPDFLSAWEEVLQTPVWPHFTRDLAWKLSPQEAGRDAQVITLDKSWYGRVKSAPFIQALDMLQDIRKEQDQYAVHLPSKTRQQTSWESHPQQSLEEPQQQPQIIGRRERKHAGPHSSREKDPIHREPDKPVSEQEPIKPVPEQEPIKPVSEQEPIKPVPEQEPIKPVPEQEPIKTVPEREPIKPVPEQEPIKLVPEEKPIKLDPEKVSPTPDCLLSCQNAVLQPVTTQKSLRSPGLPPLPDSTGGRALSPFKQERQDLMVKPLTQPEAKPFLGYQDCLYADGDQFSPDVQDLTNTDTGVCEVVWEGTVSGFSLDEMWPSGAVAAENVLRPIKDLRDYVSNRRTEAVVGLCAVIECCSEGQVPFYLCVSCKSRLSRDLIINHVLKYRHRQIYLGLRYPWYFQGLMEGKGPAEQSLQLMQIAKEVEEQNLDEPGTLQEMHLNPVDFKEIRLMLFEKAVSRLQEIRRQQNQAQLLTCVTSKSKPVAIKQEVVESPVIVQHDVRRTAKRCYEDSEIGAQEKVKIARVSGTESAVKSDAVNGTEIPSENPITYPTPVSHKPTRKRSHSPQDPSQKPTHTETHTSGNKRAKLSPCPNSHPRSRVITTDSSMDKSPPEPIKKAATATVTTPTKGLSRKNTQYPYLEATHRAPDKPPGKRSDRKSPRIEKGKHTEKDKRTDHSRHHAHSGKSEHSHAHLSRAKRAHRDFEKTKGSHCDRSEKHVRRYSPSSRRRPGHDARARKHASEHRHESTSKRFYEHQSGQSSRPTSSLFHTAPAFKPAQTVAKNTFQVNFLPDLPSTKFTQAPSILTRSTSSPAPIAATISPLATAQTDQQPLENQKDVDNFESMAKERSLPQPTVLASPKDSVEAGTWTGRDMGSWVTSLGSQPRDSPNDLRSRKTIGQRIPTVLKPSVLNERLLFDAPDVVDAWNYESREFNSNRKLIYSELSSDLQHSVGYSRTGNSETVHNLPTIPNLITSDPQPMADHVVSGYLGVVPTVSHGGEHLGEVHPKVGYRDQVYVGAGEVSKLMSGGSFYPPASLMIPMGPKDSALPASGWITTQPLSSPVNQEQRYDKCAVVTTNRIDSGSATHRYWWGTCSGLAANQNRVKAQGKLRNCSNIVIQTNGTLLSSTSPSSEAISKAYSATNCFES